MQTTAGSWYVLNETNSTTSLAIFVVVSMTPSLALNPVGGRLMDKYSPVLLIKILAPLAAIAPLAIAALFVSQALTVPLILVLTFFGSVFRALQAPTFNKILPLTVPEDQRATVLGYSGIVFNISRSVGPVIAGIAGTGLAYLFAGIGFLLVTALMMVTPLKEEKPAREASTQSQQPSGYREALRTSWQLPTLRLLFACVLLFYLVSGSVHQLLAAVAKDTSSTSLALGLLYAFAAVGAMLVNPAVLRYLKAGHDTSVLLLIAILGVGVTVTIFGFGSTLAFDLTLMVSLGALGEVMYLSAQRSILLNLESSNSGAIFGLFLAALTGAGILGSIGLGFLMDQIGVRLALTILGAATILACVPIIVTAMRQRRSATRPAD